MSFPGVLLPFIFFFFPLILGEKIPFVNSNFLKLRMMYSEFRHYHAKTSASPLLCEDLPIVHWAVVELPHGSGKATTGLW